MGDKALERLSFEGLEQDKAIIERGGRFFQQPREFARHHFAFYQCYVVRCVHFFFVRIEFHVSALLINVVRLLLCFLGRGLPVSAANHISLVRANVQLPMAPRKR